jgi:MFS family permease
MPGEGMIDHADKSAILNPPPVEEIETSPIETLPRWPAGALGTTFRSLRHRNYRLYFFGQLVSLVGTWMQMTALSWLAFEVTGKNTFPALISAVQILPTFLFGAWCGALADHWPKRPLIIATQSAFLMQAFLLAWCAYGNTPLPWTLVILSALGGLVQAVDLPARLAFVMDMAGREDLMNAVALNSLLFNGARVIGPMLASWLLYFFQPWACFLVNGISYIAVIWALASMHIVSSPRTNEKAAEAAPRAPTWAGFHYLVEHRHLGFLMLLVGTTALFGWPFLALLPGLAQHRLGLVGDQSGYALGAVSNGFFSWHPELRPADCYSLMLSGTGIGAFAAAWVLASFGAVRYRRRLIVAGVSVLSAALVGLSVSTNLHVAVLFCGFIGFGLILFLATSQSVLQLSSAEYNRGKIMGIYAMTLSGAIPAGNLLAGPYADRWGEGLVLGILGFSCFAAALVIFGCYRRLKRLVPPAASPSTSGSLRQ